MTRQLDIEMDHYPRVRQAATLTVVKRTCRRPSALRIRCLVGSAKGVILTCQAQVIHSKIRNMALTSFRLKLSNDAFTSQ